MEQRRFGKWWNVSSQRRAAAIGLFLVAFFIGSSIEGRETPCLRVKSEELLTDLMQHEGPRTVNAGQGLFFHFSQRRAGDKGAGTEVGRRSLEIKDKENCVRQLPESFYWAYGLVEKDQALYWIIGELTGGEDSHYKYHLVAKTKNDVIAHYLGTTEGTPNASEDPLICRGEEAYFEDSDARFVRVQRDEEALSQLVFPRFYHLTERIFAVNNTAFKDRYLEGAAQLEGEIARVLTKRNAKPESILLPDRTKTRLSDELAQLLVKKTILYLYGREDKKAWATFFGDIESHYNTTEGAGFLKEEIERILKMSPY